MRMFITGGAGFIGSCFVRRALQQGHTVTNFDALTYAGNLSTVADIATNPNYTFVEGNICDFDTVMTAMAEHEAVIHFAAESHVDRSITGPFDFVTTNTLGTSMIMEAARRLEVSRIIHISTDETYGSVDEGSFSETDKLTPRSPYSASKAGSDLIALSFFTTYGLPVIVTRASNNYGPYQYPEKLIPRFVTNLLDDKKVPLMGDGGNVRDWMYVDDHCAGIEAVFERGEIGEIYNIGAGNEATNNEITARLLDLTGRNANLIEKVADRLGHDRRYSVDTSKVRALGWAPQVNLENGLALTVDWYKNRRDWWEALKD